MEEKRLIEVDFPLKEVSEESVREKSMRHGYISTLHTWWARKPLAASRASVFAALVPDPADDAKRKQLQKFIVELCKWENSDNQSLIKKARKIILEANGEKPPKILDCFAGGGSIPLEAIRLGCETYALEYNPVAVLILKSSLEYPQKYGRTNAVEVEGYPTTSRSEKNPLLEAVKKLGKRVYDEVWKEIGKFYPPDPDGSIPIAYLWARTVRCQNPLCGAEIPLLMQLWLAKKSDERIALKLVVDKEEKNVIFKIVKNKQIDFDPSEGTTRKGSAMCPVCGSGTRDLSKLARKGEMGQRLIAVVLHREARRGKVYRIAKPEDFEVFLNAERYLLGKINQLKWDCSPIPDEPTPEGKGPGAERAFSLRNYALHTWGDLFNSRQKLAILTFVEKVRSIHETLSHSEIPEDFLKAVLVYLGLGIDRLVDFGSTLCMLNPTGGRGIVHTLGRQTMSIAWTYAEFNPFYEEAAGWPTACEKNEKWIQHASQIPTVGYVSFGSATALRWPDNHFDAVITDPPYYDNIPYSYLSDFFYVWLKRAIGHIHADLFATPLTPKSDEIVAYSHGSGGFEEGKKLFEKMMTKAFGEICRVLKPDGIAVIVFAYKSTEAWEVIINSLLNSGLVLTASWPVHTEMKGRLRAQESAALASSVYMVCKKRTEERTAYLNEIKEEINERIKEKLTQFWEQGISGADFFVSAIGPAVEVFGKYSRVEKLSGEEVSVQELLEYVRKVVSEFALERVLKRADLGGVDAETRFYLLWRWTFGSAKVQFDDAIKLSRPMGVELTQLWDGGGFVKKEKEFIRVLDPKERARDPVFLRKTKFTSMIDVLHYVVVLWERGEKERIKEILNETGYAGNEIFWQTAQAISEILPPGDKEKQLLQGFLYGKEAYIKEAARGKKTLLDFTESG